MPVLDASVVIDCIAPDVSLSSRAVRTWRDWRPKELSWLRLPCSSRNVQTHC